MEEIFRFVAPRAKRALPEKGTLGEMHFGGTASILVQRLSVPIRPSNPSSTQALSGSPRRSKKRQSPDSDNAVTFSDLPPEVHGLIFDQLEFIEDTICLGLTSQYFWTLARGHVHDYYTSFLGTWPGKNIVCVEEDVEPDDYPPRPFLS